MAHLDSSMTVLSIRDFPGHYWGEYWCDHKTLVTDGYREWWIHGERRGGDLRVFFGSVMVDLDPGVLTHEDAVQMCIRQFSPSRKAVRV